MKKEINKKFKYISKSKPLVSVIIPSFNRFDYLKNAIQSIFKQTYDNFEVIIINDGSTDNRYLDIDFGSKVHTVHLKQNQKEVYGFGPGSIRRSVNLQYLHSWSSHRHTAAGRPASQVPHTRR